MCRFGLGCWLKEGGEEENDGGGGGGCSSPSTSLAPCITSSELGGTYLAWPPCCDPRPASPRNGLSAVRALQAAVHCTDRLLQSAHLGGPMCGYGLPARRCRHCHHYHRKLQPNLCSPPFALSPSSQLISSNS